MISALFKSIGRPYLDVILRSGDLRVRIVERPALWMRDGQLADLQDQLRSVAGRVLPHGDLTYGVFAHDGSRLRDTVVTIVTKSDGTPVAFNALGSGLITRI